MRTCEVSDFRKRSSTSQCCLNLLGKGGMPVAKFPDLASTFPIHYDLAQHNISKLVKLLAWH
jgi:hypothetical protein